MLCIQFIFAFLLPLLLFSPPSLSWIQNTSWNFVSYAWHIQVKLFSLNSLFYNEWRPKFVLLGAICMSWMVKISFSQIFNYKLGVEVTFEQLSILFDKIKVWHHLCQEPNGIIRDLSLGFVRKWFQKLFHRPYLKSQLLKMQLHLKKNS